MSVGSQYLPQILHQESDLFQKEGTCPDIKVILNDHEDNLVKVGIKDLLPFACM